MTVDQKRAGQRLASAAAGSVPSRAAGRLSRRAAGSVRSGQHN